MRKIFQVVALLLLAASVILAAAKSGSKGDGTCKNEYETWYEKEVIRCSTK